VRLGERRFGDLRFGERDLRFGERDLRFGERDLRFGERRFGERDLSRLDPVPQAFGFL